jgi:thiol-disulfide isomerase/thioredoxin
MSEEDSIEDEILRPAWKRIARYLGDWMIALAFTALGFWLISTWRTPSLPDTAPEWRLEDLDGGLVQLSDYEGKTVVLNFWATWCKPCLMKYWSL